VGPIRALLRTIAFLTDLVVERYATVFASGSGRGITGSIVLVVSVDVMWRTWRRIGGPGSS
jgi:hypothetical protein